MRRLVCDADPLAWQTNAPKGAGPFGPFGNVCRRDGMLRGHLGRR
nr:hypothetical protein [Kibdelosporangium sp. MJ126-NF4]CTQ99289.1 hypothetical protein [Kibdelosporangium sp. MJ126-NF4]